ncbi:MAG: 6-phosphogluconolactonase [Pseudomonadales bacterium]|nr:6-phosphogluconolactonase [Pseudomonadales bacterium]NNM11253.1 6-phosphogluconolactonase [Pseudomonadales bacterium]
MPHQLALEAISKRYLQHAELAAALAIDVAGKLNKAIVQRGIASVAFSGGSTPKLFLRALAAQTVDWSRVQVSLVDDRCVAASEDRSNARLLQAALFDLLAVKPQFHPLYIEGESLACCEQRIANLPLPFDCLVLGMGDDAHTASFFPDADNLAEMLELSDTRLIGETRSKASVERRLTFRLPAVLASRNIILHICGPGKWQVLNHACEALAGVDGDVQAVEQQYPILAVLGRSSMQQEQGVPAAVYHAQEC